MLCFSVIDDRVIPKTNEKRSGSIVGKELDLPPQKKGGSSGRTRILERSWGPFTSSSFLLKYDDPNKRPAR